MAVASWAVLRAYGPALARERVEAALSEALGRPVRVAEVRLRPWLAGARVAGVIVAAGPTWDAGVLFRLERVDLTLGISSVWRREVVLSKIALTGLDLEHEASGEGAAGPAGPILLPGEVRAGPVTVRIALVELHDARVLYRDPRAGQELEVRGLEATARPGPELVDLTVRAETLRIETPGVREAFVGLTGDARVRATALTIRELTLEWEGRRLRLVGDVEEPWTAPRLAVTVQGEIPLAPVAARVGAAWPVEGIATVEATLAGPATAPDISARVSTPRLTADRLAAENVAIRGAWADGTLRLDEVRARLVGGALRGSLEWTPARPAETRVRLGLEAASLAGLESLVGTSVGLSGTARLEAELDGDLSRPADAETRFRVWAADLSAPEPLAPLGRARVEAEGRVAGRVVELRRARAEWPGVGVDLDGRVGFDGTLGLRGRLTAEIARLAALESLADVSVGLRGTLRLEAEVDGDFRQLADATSRFRVWAADLSGPGPLAPLGRARVEAEGRVAGRVVELRRAHAEWPGVGVDLEGRVGFDGTLGLRARLTAETARLAALAGRDGVGGQVTVTAEAAGRWPAPELRASFAAPTLAVAGIALHRVEGAARLGEGTLALERLAATVGDSRLTATGTATWPGPGLPDADTLGRALRFRVDLSAPSARLEDAASWLPADFRGTGAFALAGRVEGTLAAWRGSGTIEAPRLAWRPAAVADLRAAFTVTPDRLEVGSLSARVLDVPLGLTGAWRWAGGGSATAEVGPVTLAALPGLPTRSELGGTARARVGVRAEGGKVSGSATATLDEIAVAGLALGAGTAQAAIEDRQLTATLAFPTVRLSGEVGGRLEPSGVLAGRLTLGEFDLAPIVRRFLPGEATRVGGTVAAQATFNVPYDRPRAVRAAAELGPLVLVVEGERWENRGPVRLSWAAGTLHLEQVRLQSRLGTLAATGVLADTGEVDAKLEGRVPLALLATLRPEIEEAGGTVEVTATVTGQASAPALAGEGRIIDGRVLARAYPDALRDIQARFVGSPRAVRLVEATAALGDGRLRADGELALEGGGVGAYRVGLTARGVPVFSVVEGLETVWDADLEMAGLGIRGAIRGEARLTRGSYTRDLSMLSLVAGASGGAAEPAVALPLRVTVKLDDNLIVRNRTARLRVGGTLSVEGTTARPVVFGTVEARDGQVTFRKHRFTLTQASARFTDPRRIDPILDVVATARIRDYDVTVRLSGRAAELQVRLTSTPPLPQEDLLALVAFGATRAELSQSGGGILAREAAQLVVEGLLGVETDRTALDVLEIQQNGEQGGTLVVGKRLTDRAMVVYSQSLGDAREQKLRVEYQLLGPVLVAGEQNFQGGYGADVVLRLRFR